MICVGSADFAVTSGSVTEGPRRGFGKSWGNTELLGDVVNFHVDTVERVHALRVERHAFDFLTLTFSASRSRTAGLLASVSSARLENLYWFGACQL